MHLEFNESNNHIVKYSHVHGVRVGTCMEKLDMNIRNYKMIVEVKKKKL